MTKEAAENVTTTTKPRRLSLLSQSKKKDLSLRHVKRSRVVPPPSKVLLDIVFVVATNENLVATMVLSRNNNNNKRRKNGRLFLLLLFVVAVLAVSEVGGPMVHVHAAADVDSNTSRGNRRQQRQRRNNDVVVDDSSASSYGDDGDGMPEQEVHFLVEWIGKEIYSVVNKPKYKFYIYMTIGKLPNEHDTIMMLSTICNVVYGVAVLIGFLFTQRGPMLFITLATLWIGPALVLILLGTLGCAVGAFALYPITSVAIMCLWFFLTSQLAQTIGKRLGLDHDGDGDVDWLDLLHFVAQTDLGTAVGLMKLHNLLNQANQDPFQEIHHRLNMIDRKINTSSLNLGGMSSERDANIGDSGGDGASILPVTPEKKGS